MKNAIRLSLIAVTALTLTACGGAKLGGGKQGAAQALFQASSPASKAQGAASSLLQSGITTGSVTVTGQKSGSATLTFNISDPSNTSGDLSFTIKYDNFSDNGKNYYNGSLTTTLAFNATATSANMALTFKGHVDISGEVSDFIDADITETVSATELSSQSGAVSVHLNGTIKTSSDTYTYNNEDVTFTATADLPKAP